MSFERPNVAAVLDVLHSEDLGKQIQTLCRHWQSKDIIYVFFRNTCKTVTPTNVVSEGLATSNHFFMVNLSLSHHMLFVFLNAWFR